MNKKVLTLCMIQKGPHLLLGFKKRGFGEGKWNGFGGKVQEGESIVEAAHRELYEEAGIKVKDLKKRGILEFEFDGDPQILEVHVFSAGGSDANFMAGEPRESDEMRPDWFRVEEIPYDSMWPDDRHWIPMLLAGENFLGKFLFSTGGGDKAVEVVDFNLRAVKEV